MEFEYTDADGDVLAMELERGNDGDIVGYFSVEDAWRRSAFVFLNQDQLRQLRDEITKALTDG